MIFVHLSVATIAQRLSPPNKRYRKAILSVENANIRYRVDGEPPTIETGHLLFAAGTLILENGVEIEQCQVIATSGIADVMLTLEE